MHEHDDNSIGETSTGETWAAGLSSAHDDDLLVAPESVSFLAFNDWMDVQLEQFVAKWQHAAAPHAMHGWMRDRKRHGKEKA